MDQQVAASYNQAAQDRTAELARSAPKLEEPIDVEVVGPFRGALLDVVGALAPDQQKAAQDHVPEPAGQMTTWEPGLWSLTAGVASALQYASHDVPRLAAFAFDPTKLTRSSEFMAVTPRLKALAGDAGVKAEIEAEAAKQSAAAPAEPPAASQSDLAAMAAQRGGK